MAARRRGLALLGLGSTALWAMFASAAPAMTSSPRITPPVRLTKTELAPARTFTAPFIAVDPENPSTVVASYVEMRSGRCGLIRSRDGGQSWTMLDASLSPARLPSCLQEIPGSTQSPIAFGRHHTLYFAMDGWDPGQANVGISVLLARSDDLGHSWTTTVIADASTKTGPDLEVNRAPSVVVDRRSGPQDIVYVGWGRSYPNTMTYGFQSLVAVSSDGGRTFAPPVSVVGNYFESASARSAAAVIKNQPTPPSTIAPATPPGTLTSANFSATAPRLALDDKGTLYAIWFDITIGIVPAPWHGLYLSRSTDHGKSFTVTPAAPADITLDNPILKWSPLGGSDGTLHLVYESKIPQAEGDKDITYRRSLDGGKTWSDARILNDDDPKLLAGQFLPNIAVAPNGRLDAVWWDFRNDPGTVVNDVYLTSSTDNGATWGPNVRITDRSVNRTIGPWGNGFDLRQLPGIAETNAYTIVGWDDTRLGTVDAPAQDIYGSLVQWRPLPASGSSVLRYVLAAVFGLLLAGVALTVGAIRIRRSSRTVSKRERARDAEAPAKVG
jgi:hypothetical protein